MNEFQQLIQTQEDLYNHFMFCSRPGVTDYIKNQLLNGVNVTSKIRRDVMTNERQGKITIGGTVKQIVFENLGGGVYLAKVEKLS